jgi:hypothetical protein
VAAACAPPAKTENMIAGAPQSAALGASSNLRGAIWLTGVAGGQTAGAVIRSDVGNAELHAALLQSLRANGLLAASAHEARYGLSAELVELDQPGSGIDLTATARIRYEVRAQRSNLRIMALTVSAPYTATLAETVLVFERMRIANEGAIRENIRAFVARLIRELGP